MNQISANSVNSVKSVTEAYSKPVCFAKEKSKPEEIGKNFL